METDYKAAIAAHAATDGRQVATFSSLSEGGSYESVKVLGFKTLTWKNRGSGEAMKSFGCEANLRKTLSTNERVYKRIFCSIDSEEFPELTVNAVLSVEGTEYNKRIFPKVTGILS